jgi:hypothetical protein
VQPRPPAVFIAGSLGLDFLNSIATSVETPIDWLDSGEGLMKWLAQVELVPGCCGGIAAINLIRAAYRRRHDNVRKISPCA